MSEIGVDYGQIIQVLVMVFWMFMIFKGQWLQYFQMKGKASGFLKYFRMLRNKSKQKAVAAFKKAGAKEEGLEETLERLIGHRMIQPSSVDPYGVIDKMEHILDIRENKFKKEILKLLPHSSEVERRNIDNMLGCTCSLEFIYKFVRHYYLTAEKSKNIYLLLQLSMILSELMGFAKGISSAFGAFQTGQPIGDSIGPMILATMMRGKGTKKIVKDMVCAEVKLQGRKVYLVKSEGPGGNIGESDKAVSRILEKDKQVKAIITIDAGLKMAGERTGKVEEGTGVAIGGWGIEKFKIEKIATRKKIPIHCVLVKMSYKEAIGAMTKPVADAVNQVIDLVSGYILDEAKKTESLIIIGIGNTIGVGQ